jgi:hypothetical protein
MAAYHPNRRCQFKPCTNTLHPELRCTQSTHSVVIILWKEIWTTAVYAYIYMRSSNSSSILELQTFV